MRGICITADLDKTGYYQRKKSLFIGGLFLKLVEP